MLKKAAMVLGGLVLFGALGAVAITANEILDKMEDLFSVDADDAQGVLTTMSLHNDYSGGVTSEYTLAVFELTTFDPAMPEDRDETTHVLMYFMGGDEDGSIFLMETPEEDGLDSRMWLYLPALGLTKELVSEEDQSGSFAGSSMSYSDLGGTGDLRDDFGAAIVREETRDVSGETFGVWVLELTAKPSTDADHARVLLWVSKDDYLSLRMEGYKESGALENSVEFRTLGEFEGDRIPETIVSNDASEETSSTITVTGTRRPNVPLTIDLFDPNGLGALDPAAYGFQAGPQRGLRVLRPGAPGHAQRHGSVERIGPSSTAIRARIYTGNPHACFRAFLSGRAAGSRTKGVIVPPCSPVRRRGRTAVQAAA